MMDNFYLRYYVGHKGKFGHEFLEFEFRPDGHFISVFIIRSRNPNHTDPRTLTLTLTLTCKSGLAPSVGLA